jgi:hypothetical protein
MNYCSVCGKKLLDIPEHAYAVVCNECKAQGYTFVFVGYKGTYELVKKNVQLKKQYKTETNQKETAK